MTEGEFVTQGHLGGYYADGDPRSWYPEIWDAAIEAFDVKRVVDVGCGPGKALDFFIERLGRDGAVGVDGVEQHHSNIIEHDYSTGPYRIHKDEGVDLIWSCEFVEHVAEEYVPNFLATFRAARWVMMTHAVPGQPGWHHVNCRDDAYWVETMRVAGFTLERRLTQMTRLLALATNPYPDNYYGHTGLVFERTS